MNFNKIFGVGLSKTGTTSLHYALEVLGYNAIHFPDDLIRNSSKKVYFKWKMNSIAYRIPGRGRKPFFYDILKNSNNRLLLNEDYPKKLDALTDTPVTRFYKELDKLYPGSKFIYTIRDIEKWLKSCEKHFTGLMHTGIMPQLEEELFGTQLYDREKFKNTYEKHHKEVLNYFKDRPDDLLVMDISKGEGWEKLCGFLGREIPETPFPHANITRQERNQYHREIYLGDEE